MMLSTCSNGKILLGRWCAHLGRVHTDMAGAQIVFVQVKD